MPKLHEFMSMQYMRKTCLQRREIRNFQRPEIGSVPPYKNYPETERVRLPRDWTLKEARLTPLLQNRRSLRKFGNSPISLHALAYMLWAGQGITAAAGNTLFRTSPSAGALYPIETYISAQRIEGLAPGIYHFDVAHFELELLKPGDQGDDIALSCLNQQFLSEAAVVFFWTAIYRRNFHKYGERGLRYTLMDAGHICQNTLLGAEANGCGGCPVAAFFDEEVNSLLGIDGNEESAIYLAGIGPS